MIPEQEASANSAGRLSPSNESEHALKFSGSSDFQVQLRRRVDEYFRSTGRRRRDCPQMYVKTAILLTTFAASYVALVFVAQQWWQALLCLLLLALSTAAIGFNVMHDGGHQAYSNHAWVNRAMAMTLEVIGGSSYHWYWQHGVLHHTYPNVTGYDSDVDLGVLGRLSPYQKRYRFHRWQHFYLWPLYGFSVIRWQLFGDFRDVIAGRIGTQRMPRPKGRDLAVFLLGKAVFLTLMFVIPVFFHPAWIVILCYGLAALVVGVILSVVFQLAHCVEQASFPMPSENTGRIENAWAIHQVETTVDFARRSRVAAWLLGGLNFQIEHHLFPKICHVNYPAISTVVEQTCREFGIRYQEHRSFWAGVAAHFRWLRRMGQPAVP